MFSACLSNFGSLSDQVNKFSHVFCKRYLLVTKSFIFPYGMNIDSPSLIHDSALKKLRNIYFFPTA